nr:translation initiation factor IF-2-like [Pan paniscus]
MAAQTPEPASSRPPPAPGSKSAARASFRFRLPRPPEGGDGQQAARHRGAGSPACFCSEDLARRPAPERPGSNPAPQHGSPHGEARAAPQDLQLPTLRPLASPGPARLPRSFLPSARPSERRHPAGSLKRRRLPPPPPTCRSLPLSSLRRSLHVKPPDWSQGEVGNAATYGGAGRPAPGQRGRGWCRGHFALGLRAAAELSKA